MGGTREIQKRLNNTLGWSATSGQVDNWVYEDANDVYMKDPEMQKRLMESNQRARLLGDFGGEHRAPSQPLHGGRGPHRGCRELNWFSTASGFFARSHFC